MKIEAIAASQLLVNAIDKAIEDGVLKTWARVENKNGEPLYSHTPEQWAETAMLKPVVHDDKVTFSVRWWKNKEGLSEEVKGYIVGRFTEILMVHFHNYFTKLETSR